MGNHPSIHQSQKQLNQQRREIRVVDASIQGRRSSQEDRHMVVPSLEQHPELAWFAVFDGHNGDACAEFVKNNLHLQVNQRIQKPGSDDRKIGTGLGFGIGIWDWDWDWDCG